MGKELGTGGGWAVLVTYTLTDIHVIYLRRTQTAGELLQGDILFYIYIYSVTYIFIYIYIYRYIVYVRPAVVSDVTMSDKLTHRKEAPKLEEYVYLFASISLFLLFSCLLLSGYIVYIYIYVVDNVYIYTFLCPYK